LTRSANSPAAPLAAPRGAAAGVRRRRPALSLALGLLLALATALATPVSAADAGAEQPRAPAAERAVAQLNDRLLAIVNDDSKDTAAREQALAGVLRGALDFHTIADFVLGRHGRQLSESERARFRQAFADYVTSTYARLLSRNAIAELDITVSRRVTPRTAAVATHVEQNRDEATRWIWRLHCTQQGEWRVVDLQTPGASLAVNYRSAFGSLMNSQGFDALIQEIRSHTQRDLPLPAENQAILMLIQGLSGNALALTVQ
jgi:phospholipid transport system substrate-binding protein